jgi:hypothetical protein
MPSLKRMLTCPVVSASLGETDPGFAADLLTG